MFNPIQQQEETSNAPRDFSLMLKKLFFTILLLTLFNYLNAQDAKSTKLSMGIEIGPSLTTFYGESNQFNQTLPAIGFSGGLNFQVFFNNLISVRTSYLFLMKVAKPKIGELPTGGILKSSGSNNRYSNFYYLGIPILLQFNFGKRVGFFVNIGPNLNFLVKGERVSKINDNPTQKSTIKAKKFDFGVTGGFGILIPIKERFAVTFEARNNFTLSPLYNYQMSKFYSLDFLIGFSIFNH